jgi:hypothetical protein
LTPRPTPTAPSATTECLPNRSRQTRRGFDIEDPPPLPRRVLHGGDSWARCPISRPARATLRDSGLLGTAPFGPVQHVDRVDHRADVNAHRRAVWFDLAAPGALLRVLCWLNL